MTKDGRNCGVCVHPECPKIDATIIEDKLSLRQIGERFGLSKAQIHRHKRNHLPTNAVRASLKKQQKAADAVLELAIANKQQRVAVQDRRWTGMQDLIRARGAAESDHPGSETGLLSPKTGEFDSKLARAMLDVERAAAIELGQITPDGRGGGGSASVTVVMMGPEAVAPPAKEDRREIRGESPGVQLMGRATADGEVIELTPEPRALPQPDSDTDDEPEPETP